MCCYTHLHWNPLEISIYPCVLCMCAYINSRAINCQRYIYTHIPFGGCIIHSAAAGYRVRQIYIYNRRPALLCAVTAGNLIRLLYFIPAGKEERRLWFDLINSFFFLKCVLPSLLLSIWIILCTNTLESGRKKKTGNSWSQRVSRPKVFRDGKKEKLCAYVMCVHIHPSAFLFSRVVRDAPATGNIPIVSFSP